MKKENKQQKAYRVIKSRIIERTYVPEQRLIIDQIAKELKTSSIPVREAIRQLEAERLIFYKQNIGPVVARVNEADYSDTLRVLAVLEGYATSLSAERISTKQINQLKELNKSMEEALEEFEIQQYGELNSKFHQVICSLSDNEFLMESIYDTWDRLDSIRGVGSNLYSVRVKESIEEHKEIIELMESGEDLKKLEDVARMHKIKTAEDFERRRLKDRNVNK